MILFHEFYLQLKENSFSQQTKMKKKEEKAKRIERNIHRRSNQISKGHNEIM
jgi:hypothetical protein